jgi:hypothetical protein
MELVSPRTKIEKKSIRGSTSSHTATPQRSSPGAISFPAMLALS